MAGELCHSLHFLFVLNTAALNEHLQEKSIYPNSDYGTFPRPSHLDANEGRKNDPSPAPFLGHSSDPEEQFMF